MTENLTVQNIIRTALLFHDPRHMDLDDNGKLVFTKDGKDFVINIEAVGV